MTSQLPVAGFFLLVLLFSTAGWGQTDGQPPGHSDTNCPCYCPDFGLAVSANPIRVCVGDSIYTCVSIVNQTNGQCNCFSFWFQEISYSWEVTGVTALPRSGKTQCADFRPLTPGYGRILFTVQGITTNPISCDVSRTNSKPFTAHTLTLGLGKYYLGINLFDSPSPPFDQLTATAGLWPEIPELYYSWNCSSKLEFDPPNPISSYAIVKEKGQPSDSFQGDRVAVSKVCPAVTKNLTVVKVNVDLGVPEAQEENPGSYQCADEITLVPVTFNIWPADLPPQQTIAIGRSGGGILYADPQGQTAAASSYSVSSLPLTLYLKATNPAAGWITATHLDSGAKDRVKYTVLKVDTIEASCPKADNTPQTFEGHKTDFGDPCSKTAPGQSLIIWYNTVLDANYQVQDFDVTLKANVLPTSITADQLSESWAKVEGPTSGSLNQTDTFEVKYQNPKVGGLYKFEFDLGLSGCAKSGANAVLPLAGAEMLSWLDGEAKAVVTWCSNHKQATITANYSAIPGLTRRKVFETWCSISGSFFDYVFDPVDAQQHAPCRRFQLPIGPNAKYGYLTVNGVVVHGSKINNMLWALFGRNWGYREWELRVGAQINEIRERRQLDATSSQNAIGLGAAVFTLLHNNPSASISSTLTQSSLRTLQDANDLDEEKLWPASDAADTGNSTFTRPWLPTTP